MKILFIALASLLLSFSDTIVVDYMHLDTPLMFNKTEYYLAWSAQPHLHSYVQEYLPKGETLDHFNQMMHINLFLADKSVMETVGSKIKELEARKTYDGTCHYQVRHSPDKKEIILDFTLGEKEDSLMTVVEFNIYHYREVEVNDEHAVAVFAYSKRAYRDDIIPFFQDLKENRLKYLKEMIELEKPTIHLKSE